MLLAGFVGRTNDLLQLLVDAGERGSLVRFGRPAGQHQFVQLVAAGGRLVHAMFGLKKLDQLFGVLDVRIRRAAQRNDLVEQDAKGPTKNCLLKSWGEIEVLEFCEKL